MKRLLPCLAFGLVLAILLASTPHAAKAATRVVTRADDAGPGTLRQALSDAVPGDTITFSVSIFPPGNPRTIFVRSEALSLTKNNLTIDASNAGVVLDGRQTSADTNGLIIWADFCIIRGLTIQNFHGVGGNGIFIKPGADHNTIGGDRALKQGNLIVDNDGNGIAIWGAGASNNSVLGNYIGVDAAGYNPQGNKRNGVAIWDGASNNTIGGTLAGQRNVIGGNEHNGIWIARAGTNGNVVIGNYLGTRADGMGPIDNKLAGVGIHNGARNNRIGGTTVAERNLISGNDVNGIDIRDPGTNFNQVLGNFIGLNQQGDAKIGQYYNGVSITNGASYNMIGNGAVGGRNIISGNQLNGVLISDTLTLSNTVQGNYISSDSKGAKAIPNGLHGVELRGQTYDNLIGGRRSLGQGNLLSGDLNHGLVIHFDAHNNTAAGNLIGPDATGTYSLGNHPFGGVDIAEGAHDNTIGGNETKPVGFLIGINDLEEVTFRLARIGMWATQL
ncbi:MAG: hypothetical protein ACJ8CR_13025 [Roseiflexaceae bacterium]